MLTLGSSISNTHSEGITPHERPRPRCLPWMPFPLRPQAAHISTDEHKAISCHRAAFLGVQSYRNRNMGPQNKRSALRRVWEPVRCLVLEEVSMISPSLYNMLAFRSYLGRKAMWGAEEREYDQVGGVFGRMPLVIHLGDFLQLKPTGGKCPSSQASRNWRRRASTSLQSTRP